MKPKILCILPLPPPVHGAALRNKDFIESELINQQYQLHIIPIRFIKSIDDMGRFSFTKLLKAFSLYYDTISSCFKVQPDLVYFNIATLGFAFYRDFTLLSILRLLGFKSLAHIRTQGLKVKGREFIAGRLAKFALGNNHVICLSKVLSSDLDYTTPKSISIVNNGIQQFSRVKKLSLDKKNETVTFLFLSNFLASKGIDNILEASEELMATTKEFRVIIAGQAADLSHKEVVQDVDSKNLQDIVSVLPPVYGEEKVELFVGSDVFVFPTKFEAFPGVVLEAMQIGLPVISTYEGAIPEIVENKRSGILIQKGNSRELADAMEYFMVNKDSINLMGKYGRKLFLDNYTIEHYERRMKMCIDRLISQ